MQDGSKVGEELNYLQYSTGHFIMDFLKISIFWHYIDINNQYIVIIGNTTHFRRKYNHTTTGNNLKEY